MRWFRWQGGLLRQIWFWFLLLLTFNQVALLSCLYVLVIRPAADSFTTLSLALVDAGIRQQHSEPHNQPPNQPQDPVGLIQGHPISNNPIVMVPGSPPEMQSLPLYPGLRLIDKNIRAVWGDQIVLGYTAEPERRLWLHYQADKPFSIGIPIDQRMRGLLFLVVAVFLIFIISGAAAWSIAVRLSRPLNTLSDAARRLGQGEAVGELEVSKGAPPEIGRLAEALNKMRQEIDHMLCERERFLAGITHDLRTPLSRMRVALELQPAENAEFTDGMRQDIEEMRTILEQFIELSRLDMEHSEASMTGDLNAVLLSIAAKYQRAGAALQLLLGDVPSIRYKPVALNRLFYNLIDNALRYGQGAVAIKTGSDSRGVWLLVTNRESEVARDSALVSALAWVANGGQSGLGLAIVRRLADVHDAEVTIETSTQMTRTVTVTFRRE